MKILNLGLILSLATIALPWAKADVYFNGTTGVGFIGRGDVLSNIGKSALTSNPTVRFADVVRVKAVCSNTGGQLVTQEKDVNRLRTVGLKPVSVDTRKAPGNDNVSGYVLTGYANGWTLDVDVCGAGWNLESYTVTPLLPQNPPLLFFPDFSLSPFWLGAMAVGELTW